MSKRTTGALAAGLAFAAGAAVPGDAPKNAFERPPAAVAAPAPRTGNADPGKFELRLPAATTPTNLGEAALAAIMMQEGARQQAAAAVAEGSLLPSSVTETFDPETGTSTVRDSLTGDPVETGAPSPAVANTSAEAKPASRSVDPRLGDNIGSSLESSPVAGEDAAVMVRGGQPVARTGEAEAGQPTHVRLIEDERALVSNDPRAPGNQVQVLIPALPPTTPPQGVGTIPPAGA